jgi:hypothetical protein
MIAWDSIVEPFIVTDEITEENSSKILELPLDFSGAQ